MSAGLCRFFHSFPGLPGDTRHGFTLLEVLISIVVLGLVVSIVTMSLSGSIRVMDVVGDQSEIYHRARVAMMRITEDIASALPNRDSPFLGEQREVNGRRGDFMRFVSTAHIDFTAPSHGEEGVTVTDETEQEKAEPPPVRALITYEVVPLDEEEEGELALMRRDIVLGSDREDGLGAGEEDKGYLLCDRLREVRFTYIDRDGEESDDFPSAEKAAGSASIPHAVRCTLVFLGTADEKPLVFRTEISLPAGKR